MESDVPILAELPTNVWPWTGHLTSVIPSGSGLIIPTLQDCDACSMSSSVELLAQRLDLAQCHSKAALGSEEFHDPFHRLTSSQSSCSTPTPHLAPQLFLSRAFSGSPWVRTFCFVSGSRETMWPSAMLVTKQKPGSGSHLCCRKSGWWGPYPGRRQRGAVLRPSLPASCSHLEWAWPQFKGAWMESSFP